MRETVEQIREAALSEGFAGMGIAPAVTSQGFHQLVQWIEAGYAGTMDYLERRLDAYRHPSGVLEGAKSIIVLAMNYDASDREPIPDGDVGDDLAFGKTARYTWSGIDYHDVIHPKLKRIVRLIREQIPEANARGIVDTAPLMEREVAVLAGLGWRGKNTLLLNKQLGSYFFLACVLVDVELPIDQRHESSHCGTCTACLDACPTDAFPRPGVLDASKCISYLTIESSELPERHLRAGIGDWAFGCDVCQEVCPWNRRPARAQHDLSGLRGHRESESDSNHREGWLELTALFTMTDDEFRRRYRRTPFWRSRRRGMLRNAILVLGNQKRRDAIELLFITMGDSDAELRAIAVWAICQMQDGAALERLMAYRQSETDPRVLAEFPH
ncbi:Epoxyqueuosine (oQ) reductase QueG [Rhodopirellula islandica]|uniref:Epoxyqueuosine (OQ) reductase QueG n=1 Tax=Rhodopirellula islandica TaxID=595434 RepID=A0A0J1BIC1_RHOIS|nr:tRNA epoxyqueuosine(34) reductase QueG [Rhodopirellula islandica]KLU06295.1 Epoxyqueuosine (oQ) reductase QueG [Rhodopirellula islandica]